MAKFAVLLFIVCMTVGLQEASKTFRRKRYLIYPRPGSKVQVGNCFTSSLTNQFFHLNFAHFLSHEHCQWCKTNEWRNRQFIVGTGVPIPLENHAITMGWVVKSQYLLPTNASHYTDSYVTFQKRSTERRASRYDFYRTFEHAASSFGGGGKECMLRTICEASRIPLKASGLIGQVLRIFLSPSSTDETPLTISDREYHRAEILGQEKDVNCQSLYPSCSFTLVDLLTVIV